MNSNQITPTTGFSTAATMLAPKSGRKRVLAAAALAALAVPGAALLAPGAASAAPLPPAPIDVTAIDVVVTPSPAPPIPVPYPNFEPVPVPEPVPTPVPVPPVPIEVGPVVTIGPLEPISPGDFLAPTDEPEPECNEYDHTQFDSAFGRYDDDRLEVRLAYTDSDVCDFTVWLELQDDDGVSLGNTTVGLETVAFSTESAGDYQLTFDDHDLCSWTLNLAVEESLPWQSTYAEDGCDPEDGEPEDGDPEDGEPEDGDPEDGDPEDGDPEDGDPEDGEPEDGDPEDGDPEDGEPGDETPDHGTTPAADDEPLQESEPTTPGVPTGELPETGSNSTAMMLGIGFLALGSGSIAALATRRRDEISGI